jgi:hypothetical protein
LNTPLFPWGKRARCKGVVSRHEACANHAAFRTRDRSVSNRSELSTQRGDRGFGPGNVIFEALDANMAPQIISEKIFLEFKVNIFYFKDFKGISYA